MSLQLYLTGREIKEERALGDGFFLRETELGDASPAGSGTVSRGEGAASGGWMDTMSPQQQDNTRTRLSGLIVNTVVFSL
ncbi:hypothetical protein EYF80_023516 [Liparis tanakae]|uniref:Uncharacterized protein n=1 Tax=Liparis tanakae TaxID=230148 RepID=A0A4Z2HNG0_9TELE|nr:hypothetical protein EYF80_023516 [Liparis tanakae]